MQLFIPILVIIIIIIIILFIWNYVSKINSKPNINNFINNLPKEQYQQLVNLFGYPTIVRNERYGAVIWINKDIFNKIVLADELLEDSDPILHYDFLYTVVIVKIPSKSFCDVLNSNQSIIYDQIKNELTVRSNSIGANVSILLMIMKIIDNPNNTINYKNELPNIIQQSKNSDNYKMLYNELKQRIQINQHNFNLIKKSK